MFELTSLGVITIIIVDLVKCLILILSILIAVAYLTIVERKIMASIQRRLGPNAVGQLNKPFYLNTYIKIQKRDSNTEKTYNKAIETLYKNRKAPLISYTGPIVSVCNNIRSSKDISFFFKELKEKGKEIFLFSRKLTLNDKLHLLNYVNNE
jgi:hypothetical protein